MPAEYDPAKHPRGYGGRWTSGPGRSGNAHAMRGRSRPEPAEIKRLHAVVPVVATRPRTIQIPSITTQPIGD